MKILQPYWGQKPDGSLVAIVEVFCQSCPATFLPEAYAEDGTPLFDLDSISLHYHECKKNKSFSS